MATVVTGIISPDGNTQKIAHQQTGIAAVNLPPGAVVYVSSSLNGVPQFSLATGAALNAAAVANGVVMRAANAGEPVTVYGNGLRFSYALSGGLTAGAFYFLSGTVPGAIDTAASTGDPTGIFRAISDEDLVVVRAL